MQDKTAFVNPDSLYFGQIRPHTWKVLEDLMGKPPWRVSSFFHVDLVRAVQEGRADYGRYWEYLSRVHQKPSEKLAQSIQVVKDLLQTPQREPVFVEVSSILDGNHRSSVAYIQKKPLFVEYHKPYQSISCCQYNILGRRMAGREFSRFDDSLIKGKRILDVGCAQGELSRACSLRGARHVLGIDQNLTSTPFICNEQMGITNVEYRCLRATDSLREEIEYDTVLLMSVVSHIGISTAEILANGKHCLLETHGGTELPINTNHQWECLGQVSYSSEEPSKKRTLWQGTWHE
jgi:hypothetical protein